MLEPRSSEPIFRRYALPSYDESARWMALLVRLRWVAIASLVVVISFSIPVLTVPAWSLTAMSVVVLALAAANAAGQARIDREGHIERVRVYNHILLDLLALTLLLMLAGGATNPFSLLLIVHVALAGLVLRTELAVGVGILAGIAYAVLHIGYLPIDLDAHPLLDASSLLLVGRVIAFGFTGGAILWLTLAASHALAARDATLEEAIREANEAREDAAGSRGWTPPGSDVHYH